MMPALSEVANAEILIVDDNQANLEMLSVMFRELAYKVRVASSGAFALQIIQRSVPDLIILDVNLSDMDGYEICKKLKASAEWESIPVIFISASTELFDMSEAFRVGGADYIKPPFSCAEVEARIGTQLRLHQSRKRLEAIVNEKTRAIVKAQSALSFALTTMVESYDDETAQHLEHVQKISRLLALTLKTSSRYCADINDEFVKNIYRASVLHDIGKVGIPHTILHKLGELTFREFEVIKSHTTIGAKMLQAVCGYYPKNSFLHMGINIVRFHHEKWDGSGYPDGLAGENIPLAARIMAVADVYDAMRSKRCYKSACSHAKAREAIMQGIGTHFDPVIVRAFARIENKLVALYTEQ
ncbi:MAG: response regulator containing a CheY-like receiver domain and an domain [Firmicutes bacterium]|nr:response regulator containing a CheY-like receiver domain and an domain [Bacillota bacterium]